MDWINISTRIFNYSNGTRKMVRNVLGFVNSQPFSVYVATQEEAEAIKIALTVPNKEDK